MSLELLKEKFGHSGVIKKSDNREQIQQRLNAQFNNSRGDFKDIKGIFCNQILLIYYLQKVP